MSAQKEGFNKETSAIYFDETIIASRNDERNDFNGTFTVDWSSGVVEKCRSGNSITSDLHQQVIPFESMSQSE